MNSEEHATILNVDDDEAGLFAVSQMLRSAGFEVWEATTGQEALRLVSKRPDIVLLDVRLPDIDGFEVCRRIKSDPDTSFVTVIHLSASMVAGADKAYGLEGGADGYLTEPVSQAELIATIRSFLRIRSAEATQRFLARASAVLASSLAHEDSLQKLAQLAVPFLGDGCLVDQLEADGSIRTVAAAHVDANENDKFSELVRNAPSLPGLTHGAAEVIRTGEVEIYPLLTDPQPPPPELGVEHPSVLRDWSAISYVCVPLIARGRTLGAVTLVSSKSKRRYLYSDLLIVEEFAQRAALSIDNARLYEEAQQAVRSRDNLLAVVSHDLRNPLSNIFMANMLIAEQAVHDEHLARIKKQTDIIQRSAERMERLIGDLLDLASIEAGHLAMQKTLEPAESLVQEAADLFAPAALDKGLQLQIFVEGGKESVVCDRQRIQQVLANLVGNAIKFTGDGGTVKICARKHFDAFEFCVRDTGPGIHAEHLPHIFERFWKGSQTSRQGAGLGLSIAKGIVEMHGGKLWAESELGTGSTFCMTLPAGIPPSRPSSPL